MDGSKWPVKADFPIARPGLCYICGACAVTAMLFFMGWFFAAWTAFFVTLFVCWFFRDPDRDIPGDDNVIVSPADGKILAVDQIDKNNFIDACPCIKVSIFMNIFNVHVNRIPIGGEIIKTEYYPGKFFNASFDKSSKDNERNALVIVTDKGKSYAVVQIAGLIARRIICRAGRRDRLKTGDRYGMICFGSRLDIYLPCSVDITVCPGDKVKAGSSIIGYMKFLIDN